MELVDRSALISLSEQIRAQIVAQIDSGELQPGDQLLTEREYADQYGVSLAPVRTAMAALVGTRHIMRVQGRGTFVAQRSLKLEIRLLSGITTDLARAEIPFTTRVLQQTMTGCPADAADKLQIEPDSPVVLLERIVLLDTGPLVLLRSYLPGDRFWSLARPGTFRADESLYGRLREELQITLARARGDIGLIRCDPATAEHLRLPVGTVALQLDSLVFDDADVPVEFALAVYAEGGVSLSIEQSNPEVAQ